MYARVTTVYVRFDLIDKAIEIYCDSVIPAARLQKGFQSGTLLVDRENGKGLSITIWDSLEDIKANEENQYYQEQLLKMMVVFTADPIREEFEVVFQD
jgi:heme-degrading monooxygenase HmoA